MFSQASDNQVDKSGYFNDLLVQLKACASDPMSVASVCPSSTFLTSAIQNKVQSCDPSVVVDLGPGNGETSKAILSGLNIDSRLISIEYNPLFAESLTDIADSRMIAVNGDAKDLTKYLNNFKIGKADVVVSGISFSSLDETSAEEIIREIYSNLRQGGKFISYQLKDSVSEHACKLFGEPIVDRVWLNLPPLKIFSWEKVK